MQENLLTGQRLQKLKGILNNFLFFLLVSCGGGSEHNDDARSQQNSVTALETNSIVIPLAEGAEDLQAKDKLNYQVVSSRELVADGISGIDTYELIRNFGGPRSLETPDLYPINHPLMRHIVEDTDQSVGHHFVFKLHRDIDRDRDREEIMDRQRNEIKTYAQSEDAVKGFEHEIVILTWKFFIPAELSLSTRFTHFFQLKAVGGNDSQPILTLTGNNESDGDGYEIRHSPHEYDVELARVSRSKLDARWMRAYVRVKLSNEGNLRLIVSDLLSEEIVFDIKRENIDMWRGTSAAHFVRPKWGIYRSLSDSFNLRPQEEIVRFADFQISKVKTR